MSVGSSGAHEEIKAEVEQRHASGEDVKALSQAYQAIMRQVCRELVDGLEAVWSFPQPTCGLQQVRLTERQGGTTARSTHQSRAQGETS